MGVTYFIVHRPALSKVLLIVAFYHLLRMNLNLIDMNHLYALKSSHRFCNGIGAADRTRIFFQSLFSQDFAYT